MPREKPLSVGTELKGDNLYRVKRLVGGGGMAWVYQVERLSSGAEQSGSPPSLWALKELRPQTQDPDTQQHARALFNQEATLLSQLDHPNLPQVIDFFEDRGRAYLVMEFIWGESLEKRISRANSPLLEREVLRWAVQVCTVLEYLHSRQPPIIFRDLKPSNVMVNNAGLIKLVDFGIARTYKEDKLQDTIALGSENYAAPEQWGEAQTDARSDIYGLGATLYHLLANIPPSPAFLPSEPEPVSSLNPALSEQAAAIVTKAMQRDRADRYQSASEMKQVILASLPDQTPPVQAQAPLVASPAPAREQPARPVQTPQRSPLVVEPEVLVDGAVGGAASTTPASRLPASSGSAGRQASKPAVTPQVVLQKPVRRRVRKVKVCPQCKRRNELDARYCVRCGRAFGGIRPAVLRVIEPVRAAWEMPVRKSPLLLGRSQRSTGHRPDFDMTFYDPEGYVSRRHAHIIKARNGYFVADLGSSNGTFVNSRLLPPQRPRLLRNGDKITIGQVVIQFLLR
jgi:serine/threonine-protein kinase